MSHLCQSWCSHPIGGNPVPSRVLLQVGRDIETREQVFLEGDRARTVFICGKRGSGKSYTLGVLVEELFEKSGGDVTVILVDPMGIFHTMVLPNKDQSRELLEWGLVEKGLPVRLLVPGDPVRRFGDSEIVSTLKSRGVDVLGLRLNPSDLTPENWCSLFDLSINDLMGIALYRAITGLQERAKPYYLQDIERAIMRDTRAQDKTKEALTNRLSIAHRWDIFSDGPGANWGQLFRADSVNIVDVSVLDPGSNGLRSLVVDLITKQIFSVRISARRREEFGLQPQMPRVWLALDEAHQFVPSSGSSLCKESLTRWVKEGRQPGLGLIAATQQPSAMDSDLLSQCDLIIAHKITSLEDVQALNRLSATYMTGEMKSVLRNIGQRGEAVMVDDEKESVTTVAIRPRRSKHGGGETVEKKLRKLLF
ncbi:MAG TPA: ATP-binding protein [Firmicutes bacterium]|nr:ATP-binding protein [Candidatus Fermentithermobacillaceae bacterium]